ncbi:unnamed protein product, partial [Mesorhabditis spiculigera]
MANAQYGIIFIVLIIYAGFAILLDFRAKEIEVKPERPARNISKPIEILYYTNLFLNTPQPYWIAGEECNNVKKGSCIVHSNRSRISEADAVVFEPRFIDFDLRTVPRNGEQVFVFSVNESPERFGPPAHIENFFNASMNYLFTADIPFNNRYRWLDKEMAGKEALPFRPIGIDQEKLHRNRTHLISAFIGNCRSTPICMDYVTEKYWNRSTYHSVPILWSREVAKNQGIPENSVLYVEDYESMTNLLLKLQNLANSTAEYERLFSWRNNYMFLPEHPSRECNLCEYVQRRPPYKSYRNVYLTFYEQSNCQRDFLDNFLAV